MKIKNFKYKNIGIYIKNIIFVFFKNINQDVSEKNVKKINKIRRNVNKSNIASKRSNQSPIPRLSFGGVL